MTIYGLTYWLSILPRTEQAAVVECARQLRRVGDLLNWKYMLLEFIITLQKQETDGKRWKDTIWEGIWEYWTNVDPKPEEDSYSRTRCIVFQEQQNRTWTCWTGLRPSQVKTWIRWPLWIISAPLWAIFISGRFLCGGWIVCRRSFHSWSRMAGCVKVGHSFFSSALIYI